MANLRAQLKATSIKKLQKQVDAENEMVGTGSSTEYLNLEDGKTIKIRIFPAHPGQEEFYVAKKCYWLTFNTNDGDTRRGTVLDSKVHGGTKWDVVEEYVKWAKKRVGNDAEKLEALVGNGPKSNSLNPQYTWLCYADRVNGDDQLRAKLWEFKKMVRDAMNKLAFSEDEDEVIEVDPFTDPDEGLPINVTYRKNPNKKKGENYYEVAFPKKVSARPLTDEEIEYFMTLKPLSEVIYKYGMRDFERALEGLQNFDEDNEIGLFDDDDWLEHLEEIKAQYDAEEEEEKPKKSAKKVVKKDAPAPKKAVVEDEDDDEEDDDTPEEEDDAEDAEGDEFDDMDRSELKKYISKNGLEISVKKSMSDDDLREAIRAASKEEDADEADDEEEDDTDNEEEAPAKVSLNDIRKRLAGKK
jgi:hypothetical protein